MVTTTRDNRARESRRRHPAARPLITCICLSLAIAGVTAAGAAGTADAAGTTILADTFTRQVAQGWGNATTGGPWTPTPDASALQVAQGVGLLRTTSARAQAAATAATVKAVDLEAQLDFTPRTITSATQFFSLALRGTPQQDVRVRVSLGGDGSVRLGAVARHGGVYRLIAAEQPVPGLSHAAGTHLHLQAMIAGTKPMVLQAKIFPTGSTPPTQWQLHVIAGAGVSMAAGSVGVSLYSGADPDPTEFDVDNVLATVQSALPTTGSPTTTTTTPGSGGSSGGGGGSTGAPVPPADATPIGAQPDSSGYSVPSNAVYVSPSGSDSGSGSSSSPLRTVGKAVDEVGSGGTVVLRGGTYHEDVEVPSGKKVTLMGYPGEEAWFDGSSAITQWTATGGDWSTPWNHSFDHTDTTGAMVDTSANALAAYPEQVFVDDVPLSQVGSRSAVSSGTFYIDSSAKLLYVGADPAGHEVRASTLTEAYYINNGDGSKILGVGFRKYATPVARMGMVKAYADSVLVENSVFADSALAGLSIHGAGITIRSCSFIRNGQLGLQADKSNNLTINGVRAKANNTQEFNQSQAAGGIKITHTRTISVTNSIMDGNHGTGLWIDQSSKWATVVGNRFSENAHHGMSFEISEGLVFAGNEADGNETSGLNVLESDEAKVYNNLFQDNTRDINVLDGSRLATTNPNDSALDHRYPLSDQPPWEVKNVEIRGNVLGALDARTFIGYDDARKKYSADVRNVTADYDAYWRKSSSSVDYFAAWGDWPTKMLAPDSLSQFTSQAGQESHGASAQASSDPYVTGSDLPTSKVPDGPALPSDVASALGVSSGTTLPAGLPATTP